MIRITYICKYQNIEDINMHTVTKYVCICTTTYIRGK